MSHPLDCIFRPRSVAVVGASWDPTKRGHQAVRALLESGYAGAIQPVNPGGGELLGLPVARAVKELDEAPDLALICTPASSVPGVLAECADRGIRGAVVIALGFRETGAEGAALEAAIAEVARRTGIRVVGPNTHGILNLHLGLNLIGARGVRAGRLSLVGQSGNLGLSIMNEAMTRSDEGFAIYVGVGNETDLAYHDYLDYLAVDANTAAIIVYVEGFRDGRAFLETARRVTPAKPVMLLKGGRSVSGTASARSHTGALAGSYAVLRAGLRQAGVLEVTRSDALFPVGWTLARQPSVPAGAGVVVLSDGGGHATLAADLLSEEAVPLAELAQGTGEALRALLGPSASVANPVDMAGAPDRAPEVFPRALELVARDPAAGAVLLVGLFGGYAIRFDPGLAAAELDAAEQMVAAMAAAGKAVVVHSLYAATRSEPLRALTRAGVPVVESLEVACGCVAALVRRGEWLARERAAAEAGSAAREAATRVRRAIDARQRAVADAGSAVAAGSAVSGAPAGSAPGAARPETATAPSASCVAAARAERRTVLLEVEARALVAAYGVPLVEAVFCADAGAVRAAAEALARPLALKVVSPAIVHKTEAGGVILGVEAPDEAAAAFGRIATSARAYAAAHGLEADVRGVLVSPMLPAPVAELLIGVRRDPQYGPVLTVGAGGVLTELLGDVSLRVLPVGRDDARAMLEELRVAALLRGWRGRPPADRDAVADLVLALARCALAHPDVAELELNPVFVYADRAVAVDVRAILGEA